tara:strand:+ start:355 stop:867 length:513 start_codon:yes stop_codon:yes gene_type:complete
MSEHHALAMVRFGHNTELEKARWIRLNVESDEFFDVTVNGKSNYGTDKVKLIAGQQDEDWTIKTDKKFVTYLIWRIQYDEGQFYHQWDGCDDCENTGRTEDGKCRYCKGKGEIRIDGWGDILLTKYYKVSHTDSDGDVEFNARVEFDDYNDDYFLMINGEKHDIDVIRQG